MNICYMNVAVTERNKLNIFGQTLFLLIQD